MGVGDSLSSPDSVSQSVKWCDPCWAVVSSRNSAHEEPGVGQQSEPAIHWQQELLNIRALAVKDVYEESELTEQVEFIIV